MYNRWIRKNIIPLKQFLIISLVLFLDAGLAELFTAIVNVAHGLSTVGGASIGLGCLWWMPDEDCSRLWVGFLVMASTLMLSAYSEWKEAQVHH